MLVKLSIPTVVLLGVVLVVAGLGVVAQERYTQPPDLGLPTGFQCGVLGSATSLEPSAVTFVCAEGYAPWVAMIVEAGTPQGFDSVAVSFDGSTLRIEITDGTPRSVTILVNKAFADAHLDSSEQNLDIRTSEAVNYQGLQASAPGTPSGVGGPFYVFVITSFSTQWVEMSKKLPLVFIAAGVVAAVVVIGIVFFLRRRR
jgi:hypothetical protein